MIGGGACVFWMRELMRACGCRAALASAAAVARDVAVNYIQKFPIPEIGSRNIPENLSGPSRSERYGTVNGRWLTILELIRKKPSPFPSSSSSSSFKFKFQFPHLSLPRRQHRRIRLHLLSEGARAVVWLGSAVRSAVAPRAKRQGQPDTSVAHQGKGGDEPVI